MCVLAVAYKTHRLSLGRAETVSIVKHLPYGKESSSWCITLHETHYYYAPVYCQVHVYIAMHAYAHMVVYNNTHAYAQRKYIASASLLGPRPSQYN